MRPTIIALLVPLCLLPAACGDGDGDGEESGATDRGAEAGEMPEPDAGPGAPEDEAGARDDDAEKDGSGRAAERAIRAAIEDAIASGDPDRACGAAVTEAYLRDAYGDAEGCRGAQSTGLAAESVDIGKISIEGDGARTAVRAKGGPYGGERLRAQLVREGGDWKLDRLRSNVPPGP